MHISENLNSKARVSLARKMLALTACLILAGCSHGKPDDDDSPDTPAAKGPPEEVVVTSVLQKTVPIYMEFVGRTDADETVDIRARVEGTLEQFSFKEGEFVSKGQVLFKIDRQPYEASLDSKNAELEKAQSEVLQAKQQVDLKQENSELERVESALVLAKQDLARIIPLVKEGALEKRQLDVAVDNENRAKAAVDAQRAKVSNTGLNQKVQLRQALAHVSAAKAGVKEAELNLGYTTIRSPIHGIISRLKVYPGNLVGRGENTLLATISAVDPIKVNFSVSESIYLQAAKEGGSDASPRFQLMLADGTEHPYRGKYRLVDSAVNPSTGTINVQAVFPNPKAILRPGQFAKVRFIGEQRKNALLVPQRCVQEVQGLRSVLVVGPDNKVAMRTVKVGPSFEKYFVIDEGLKPGETVILEGLQKAKPGETVKISSRVS